MWIASAQGAESVNRWSCVSVVTNPSTLINNETS
jgi:hypothetical protein